MNYKGYYKKSILNTLMACIAWSGLSTYVIISKGQLGENSIPIFETILFLAGILSSRYVARNRVNYAHILTLDVIVDFVCLSAVFTLTLINGVSVESAIALYILIILTGGVTGIISEEAKRDVEDRKLKSQAGKRFLKICRGRHRDFRLYGLAIGSMLSLLLLSYFKMDLKLYALILIGVNLMQIVYDSYLIKRYLYR